MLIQYSYINIRYSNINIENVAKLLYSFILPHFLFLFNKFYPVYLPIVLSYSFCEIK